MSDFIKTKIGFALSLLGSLFAINTFVKDFSNIGFSFFGIFLGLKLFYFLTMVLLGITVYIYAFDLVSERPFSILQKIGNVFYAIALSIPLTYLFLWLTKLTGDLVIKVLKSPFVSDIIQALIGGAIGATTTLFIIKFKNKFNSIDRSKTVEKLSDTSDTNMNRANEMFNNKHYDLAVSDAFRSVESELQSVLIDRKIYPKRKNFLNMLNAAINSNILPKEMEHIINEIRIIRNKAVHGDKDIDEETAKYVLNATEKILKSIARGREVIEIKNYVDFKEMIREVVYDSGLFYWKVNPEFPKGDYDFEIEGKKQRRWIVEVKYWDLKRGKNFPSEQIKKYVEKANKFDMPFLLVSNASELTHAAQDVLNEFNNQFDENKLLVILGSTKEDFISQFKKKVD